MCESDADVAGWDLTLCIFHLHSASVLSSLEWNGGLHIHVYWGKTLEEKLSFATRSRCCMQLKNDFSFSQRMLFDTITRHFQESIFFHKLSCLHWHLIRELVTEYSHYLWMIQTWNSLLKSCWEWIRFWQNKILKRNLKEHLWHNNFFYTHRVNQLVTNLRVKIDTSFSTSCSDSLHLKLRIKSRIGNF